MSEVVSGGRPGGCPFCRAPHADDGVALAVYHIAPDQAAFQVECRTCMARGPLLVGERKGDRYERGPIKQAVDLWNRAALDH